MKGILVAGGELVAAEDGKSGFEMLSPLLPKLENASDTQADVHTSELFIKLLCQYEPDGVLNFLQSHQAYRVQVSHTSNIQIFPSSKHDAMLKILKSHQVYRVRVRDTSDVSFLVTSMMLCSTY
jgi:hypothetical protein